MERIATGISGLDKLISGYPKEAASSSACSRHRKTIFALHLAKATCEAVRRSFMWR
jgi:KaiC/GvpD/RAD55 family RecA-like ATPase